MLIEFRSENINSTIASCALVNFSSPSLTLRVTKPGSFAMELALSLEKLTNEKLLNLHEVASRNNDLQLADFVESEFLGEQVWPIDIDRNFMEPVGKELKNIGKKQKEMAAGRHDEELEEMSFEQLK
ncbi:ferritin-3, chloroplastic, partial [Tanacetum coccineum]